MRKATIARTARPQRALTAQEEVSTRSVSFFFRSLLFHHRCDVCLLFVAVVVFVICDVCLLRVAVAVLVIVATQQTVLANQIRSRKLLKKNMKVRVFVSF